MRIAAALALAGLALLAAPGQGAARIHGQMYCWALDSELPIVCDAEEAEEVSGIRDQGLGPWEGERFQSLIPNP
jgi:hypothetical protein